MQRPVTRKGVIPIAPRANPRPGRVGRLAIVIASLATLPGLHAATAAHAQIGTPVPNVQMRVLEGGTVSLLRDVDANVLVFFRPNQERSLSGLKELAGCQKELGGKSIQWTAIVSDSASVESAATLIHESGIGAPVLRDAGDSVYGGLGVSLHPVVVIVGRDGRLAAFEPFRSVNYCAVVKARIRRLLNEISDDELQTVLNPPKTQESGNGQAARRYHALAEALFKAKNYDKALQSVRTSLEKDPSQASAHTLLGDILSTQGRCEEAVPAYGKALEFDADNLRARDGMARCKPAH